MPASALNLAVLPSGYTHPMAKVMISIPDTLLGALDAEVKRRQTTRSALLQNAARRELGILRRDRGELLADLDAFGRTWQGPVDAAALVRADRSRDE